MPDNVKRIDIKEFQEAGYLQEVNRMFLHPLGLALEVIVEEDGSVKLGGVWDCRDHPEGMLFGDFDTLKAARIEEERIRRRESRQALRCCNLRGIQSRPYSPEES